MDPRTLARVQALGRVAIGTTLALAPARTGRAWVGSDGGRPTAALLTTAVGARDLALGLGTAYAVGQGYGARSWLRAGVLADSADLIATLRAREHIPAVAAVGVAVLAGGSAALGLWLDAKLD